LIEKEFGKGLRREELLMLVKAKNLKGGMIIEFPIMPGRIR